MAREDDVVGWERVANCAGREVGRRRRLVGRCGMPGGVAGRGRARPLDDDELVAWLMIRGCMREGATE